MSKSKRCPYCGKKHSSTSRYCSVCGRPLPAELSKNRVWQRNPDELAVRLEIQDINGLLRRPLTVEEGTGAIWLQGGRLCGILPSGVYSLGDVTMTLGTLRLEDRATAVLLDTGTLSIRFNLGMDELRSHDDIPLAANGRLTLKLDLDSFNKTEVVRCFLENLMKHRVALSLDDLEREIHDSIRFSLQKFALIHTAQELKGIIDSDSAMQDVVCFISPALADYGLKVVRFNSLFFNLVATPTGFCRNCGCVIFEGDRFCRNCGHPVIDREVK